MNNFNLNNINLSSQIATQKANMVKALDNNNTNNPQPNIQYQTQNNNHLSSIILNNNFTMPPMENEVILKYLQNLLNLPNSIDKFISNPNDKLTKVIIENLINVKSLNRFLNENSKEAILKVIDTISQSIKSGISDVSDLKNVLNILNIIQANSNDLSSNTIKELLLLYIPLSLPIFEKKAEFSNLTKEEEEKTKESSLSILFETINFSNILISMEESEIGVFIYIYSTDLFPKERFEKITKSFLNKTNINVLFEFHQRKESVSQSERQPSSGCLATVDRNQKTQNFSIISNDYLKPESLILAHIMITTVLKLDNDFT